MELLTIAAIVLGPFIGIFVHGKLEDRKTTYQRKLDIFKTLMGTRATPLARAHVESLNRIDIEFTGSKEKKSGRLGLCYSTITDKAPPVQVNPHRTTIKKT